MKQNLKNVDHSLKQVKSAWGAVLLDMSATFHDKKIHKRFKVERKPSGGDCRV